MSPKTQRRLHHSPAVTTPHHVQPSDLDSDAYTPTPTLQIQSDLPPTQVPRTNEALNFSVLQRHVPSVTSVLSIAPYAVIYTFSPTAQTWEKCGIEGTLFVCQLSSDVGGEDSGLERFAVIVLNRRGLDNFNLELTHEDDVEVTEEYIILQGKRDDGDAALTTDTTDTELDKASRIIYGLWIFAEAPPSSTAQMRDLNARLIQDCAKEAEASRKALQQRRSMGEVSRQSQRLEARFAPQSFGLDGMGYDIQTGVRYNDQEPIRHDDQRGVGYGGHGIAGYDEPLGTQNEYNSQGGAGYAGFADVGFQGQQLEGQPRYHLARGAERWQAAQGTHNGGQDVLGALFRKARQGYSNGN